MSYAFSLEVVVDALGSSLRAAHATLRHVFDESVVMMPEGLRVDIPPFAFRGGDGQIGSPASPSSNRLLLRVTGKVGAGDGDPINLECTGVVDFDGGARAFQSRAGRPVRGSAVVAIVSETSSATYRWLGRRLLFGVGRVEGEWQEDLGARLLTFSFDVYAAV